MSRSRVSSPALVFWTNLALVLPLALGAFILYPGCNLLSPPCETDADCGGLSCDPAAKVCVAPPDENAPFGPAGNVQIESTNDAAGASPELTIRVPFSAGSLQVLDAAIALNGGAAILDLPNGEIGTFSYQDEGGIDQDFAIIAQDLERACVDENGNDSCDQDEVEIVIEDIGGAPVILLHAPHGGDHLAAQKVFPDNGSVTLRLDSGIVVNPIVTGPWNVIGVFSSVDPNTGDEGPDQRTAQVVIDLVTQSPGSAAGCDVTALDTIDAHLVGTPAIEVTQMGAVFDVPPSPGGPSSLHRVCVSGAWRPIQGGGGASQGQIEAVVYGVGATSPLQLRGVSRPFLVSVNEETDTHCIEEVAIDVGEEEEVFVGVQWNSSAFDFAPAIEQGGVPREGFVRLSDDGVCGLGEAPWRSFAELGGNLTGIAIGASFREEQPVQIEPSSLLTWLDSVPPAEVAAAVTNRGALLTSVSLEQEGPTQQFLRVTSGNLAVPSTATSALFLKTERLSLNNFAFGVSDLVPDPNAPLSHVSYVLGNALQAIRIETQPQPNAPPTLAVTKETISPALNHWESNLALFGDRLIAQAFRALPSPFFSQGVLFERNENGSWDEIAIFDDDRGTDGGAIFRGCPRRELYTFEDSDYACTAYPLATLAGGVCTEYRLALSCCDLSQDSPECTFGDLSGIIGAGDRNAESAGFSFEAAEPCSGSVQAPASPGGSGGAGDAGARAPVARDALGVPKVPAGAYFWVRGFQTATSSGVIDVATFTGDGAGGFTAAGSRSGLEEVRTTGGFPNLTVHHEDGSDGFTLCVSAVEGGAQRVRCSQWSMGGSADPADWRKRSSFLAPPAYNRSSPIEIVGSGAEPRAGMELPLLLVGPSQTGAANGPATMRAHRVLETRPCVPGPGVACLGEEDRFAVLADWRTPPGATGIGNTREITADSGVATFFNPTNVELFYKALDACTLPAFRSKFFFLTGLTNVEVVTTFLDTETGRWRKYQNPLQRPFSAVLDTGAFVDCQIFAADARESVAPPLDAGAMAAASRFVDLPDWAIDALAEAAQRGGPPLPVARSLECVPSGTRLCLTQGRFAVDVSFSAPNGSEGDGKPLYLTTDTGAFTFFNPENLEVLVKVLDACSTPFESFFVFAAGLTNVAVEMTVTDTATGVQKTYTNPQNKAFVPVQDVATFKTCDG